MSTEKQAAEAAIRAAYDALIDHIGSNPDDSDEQKSRLEFTFLHAAMEHAGWDFEADQDFADWALRATDEELYPENLRRTLEALDKRFPNSSPSV
jgi:hypothetical protein